MQISELILAGMMRKRILGEIGAERDRQFYTEGFGLARDDEYTDGELARAAGVYALLAGTDNDAQRAPFTIDEARRLGWPWAEHWWKPRSPRADLVRAAALIVAEIERLDRAANRARA